MFELKCIPGLAALDRPGVWKAQPRDLLGRGPKLPNPLGGMAEFGGGEERHTVGEVGLPIAVSKDDANGIAWPAASPRYARAVPRGPCP